MNPIDPASVREFLEAVVTALSILGGAMAYCSGQSASRALAREQRPEVVSHEVNRGIALGFELGWPLSVTTFMIATWTFWNVSS